MATLWAAEYFGLQGIGAVAPGYTANLLVLEDLDTVKVRDVYTAAFGWLKMAGCLCRCHRWFRKHCRRPCAALLRLMR